MCDQINIFHKKTHRYISWDLETIKSELNLTGDNWVTVFGTVCGLFQTTLRICKLDICNYSRILTVKFCIKLEYIVNCDINDSKL